MSDSVRARTRALRPIAVAIAIAALAAGSAYALAKSDPGADYLHQLAAQSNAIFGFGTPLNGGIKGTFDGPGDQAVELAQGLEAHLVSDKVGEDADMIALWPNDDHPTHAIICNEIDSTVGDGIGFGPSSASNLRPATSRTSPPARSRAIRSTGQHGARSSSARKPAPSDGSTSSSTRSTPPASRSTG